ncbi:MAG TPA: hybrid sensor histidine kinase/response regulator [Candidatus Desulfaltia sp.]|nr:hybrid sensor histidine kinase/response regulator [Candidatus Desulfaltia sp.]
MAEKPIILIIDDEEAMRDSCSMILTKDGFRAETAENGQVGLEKVRALKPALTLIDLKMPGLSGFEVLEKLRDIDPQNIPIVITGYATVESAVEAMKKGAYDFLPKPFTPDELRIIIRRALERRKLAQEAETLRREKKLMEENFITMVSHQLRSPLVAIQQYFEVILAGMVGRVDDAQKEMIVRAQERLGSLLHLINDWLDMARITRGQLVDKFLPIALEKLLDRQVEFMKPLAQEYKVRLELRPPERPALALGDEQSLEQVFSNLISNAIKYNRPEGSVIITVREEEDSIITDVTDTGIGIAREHLPLVFDQFYRVSRSEDQKIKGTGLGLAIAKKIVEAHNGSIQVASEPGRGSTFSVRLPRAKPEEK